MHRTYIILVVRRRYRERTKTLEYDADIFLHVCVILARSSFSFMPQHYQNFAA